MTAAPANSTSLNGGYDRAVSRFHEASRGRYGGPAITGATLDSALRAVEGLDPPALLEQTRAAVGDSSPGSLRVAVLPAVGRLLAEVAVGAIVHKLIDAASDWFDNRSESRDLEDSAEETSDALTDITEVSETGIAEILVALEAVIDQLCTFLAQVDPTEHPYEFNECVRTGSDLIDDAGQAVLECCRERDEAVSGCLDEFLARGEAVCDRTCRVTEIPDCAGPSEQQTPGPAPVPESKPQPAPAPEPEVPVKPVPEPQPTPEPKSAPVPEKDDCPPEEVSTTPQTVTPEPEPEPVKPESGPPPNPVPEPEPEPGPAPQPAPVPEKDDCPPEEVPTTPQTVTPEPGPAPPEDPTEPYEPSPEEPSDPVPEAGEPCEESPDQRAAPGDTCPPETATSGSSCCGVLGVLGVGVALVAIGALATVLEDSLVDLPEMTPEPVPGPSPETEPEPEVGEVAEPPAELADVSEPPPPPKQNVVAAAPPPEPAPALPPPPPVETFPPAPADPMVEAAHAPTPAPSPPPGESQPEPVSVPESELSLGGARKAGQW